MREIVMDTETTGFEPSEGHRLVEIGCLEVRDYMPTGETFHIYINPERDMPEGAFGVHGLSEEFLSAYPVFADQADAFLDFIQDSKLVIHNAAFDMKFLNFELAALGKPILPMDRAIDTLAIARRKYPGQQNSLDALCRRFNIDNSSRTLHGALLDSELLAEVYVELRGGRQTGFDLSLAQQTAVAVSESQQAATSTPQAPKQRPARHYEPTQAEREAHAKFLEDIRDPLWLSADKS